MGPTSVTHFQVLRLLLTRNEDAGTTRQLLAARFTPTSVQTTACGAQAISQVKNRPSQGLRVVDGEGMVQTANRTPRLRTASAAAKSASLKRPVRVRLYPRAPCFTLLRVVTHIDMCYHFLVWNDGLQHLRKRPVEGILTASDELRSKCPRKE